MTYLYRGTFMRYIPALSVVVLSACSKHDYWGEAREVCVSQVDVCESYGDLLPDIEGLCDQPSDECYEVISNHFNVEIADPEIRQGVLNGLYIMTWWDIDYCPEWVRRYSGEESCLYNHFADKTNQIVEGEELFSYYDGKVFQAACFSCVGDPMNIPIDLVLATEGECALYELATEGVRDCWDSYADLSFADSKICNYYFIIEHAHGEECGHLE